MSMGDSEAHHSSLRIQHDHFLMLTVVTILGIKGEINTVFEANIKIHME